MIHFQLISCNDNHLPTIKTSLSVSIESSRTKSEAYWMKLIDSLKPFAEELGFSDTMEGYLKDTVSVLALFKASQSYPHETALKMQCSWTKQYLQMELSDWPITSVRDKYLKKEVENALAFPSYASLERLDHRRKLLSGPCVDNTRVMKTFHRWIVDNRLQELKFARQKLPYCYFSGAATLFSLELSDARISWAKGGVLATVEKKKWKTSYTWLKSGI